MAIRQYCALAGICLLAVWAAFVPAAAKGEATTDPAYEQEGTDGETTGAQYVAPRGLPVALDNSGAPAGVSAGEREQPVRSNWRSFKKKAASANTTAGGASAAGGGQSAACSGPSGNVRVYTRTSPERVDADFGKMFDLNSAGVALLAILDVGKPKAYEFSNSKGYLRGKIHVFYDTGPMDMAISACPGNFNVPEECKAISTRGPGIFWSKNGAQYAPVSSMPSYIVKTCNIGAGGKVYLNLRTAHRMSYQLHTYTLK